MTTIDEANKLLSSFLKLNPSCKIAEIGFDRDHFVISNPWNESGMLLLVDCSELNQTIERLNRVNLPERLSAVLDTESNELEVIWTAYKLPSHQADIPSRQFTFLHGGKEHECSFRPSSDTVKDLGKMMGEFAPSDTSSRNLQSYSLLAQADDESENDRFGETCSFYVSNIDRVDEDAIDLIRHLNFYLNYYDESSPFIMIHPPSFDQDTVESHRFIEGEFPKEIQSSDISPDLLQFWTASRTNDNSQKFLFAYRIVENISTRYIDEKCFKQVQQHLRQPSALSNVEKLTGEIVGLISSSKIHDNQKIESLLKSCVRPEAIWPFVEKYKEILSTPTEFDGGFKCDALFADSVDLNYFKTNGVSNIGQRSREIRNALSHGSDSKTAFFITPTKRNSQLMRPWSEILTRIAAEVLIFNNA